MDLARILGADRALLVRFLDTIGDALFVVDAERRITWWNRQAELLTGFGAEEVIGRSCLAGIKCERCQYECRLFEQGTLEDARISLRSKDGRQLQVRKNAFVLADDEGRVLGGVELLRDETELVERIESCRAQRGIIEERERLQAALLGSIKEGVLTIDPSFRITSFSRRAEEITGRRAEEVIGLHCHDVIGSPLCDGDCPAEHCVRTGDSEAERTTESLDSGGRPLPMAEVAVPLRDESSAVLGTVLIIEDRRGQPGLEAEEAWSFQGIIGRSKAMRRVFQVVEQVAPTDVTVLLTGESGTGKELVAHAIHQRSGRRAGPFQAINCAALPDTLLESELFGHSRGAFTGADRARPGRIEAASGGSLFLDEIGEMSLALQAKLLRFLQDHEYQRVGENETRTADVRVLAATNRDLKEAVAKGLFREDLYYRIRVIPIELPPLRARPDDIPLLAARLLAELAPRRGRPELTLTPAAIQRLCGYQWPGNVRELVNALEYAVALSPGRRIRAVDLPSELSGPSARYSAPRSDPSDEKDRILEALAKHDGNRTRAAQYLGMDRVTLYRKMKRFGLS
ncbi:MAG: sigma 54-interacting transcriptional regulator [Polyangia bacterium]|jgi:PAS domain S-box-containing protein|nr:sigma 54-interacting transcriptional regulator [Polyangia bacterium]